MRDQWIPTPGNGEGGRLPTEADTPWDGPNKGHVEVTTHDSEIEIMAWDSTQQYARAWRPLPAPYVPPEPEKPKRDSVWLELTPRGDLFNGEIFTSERSAIRNKNFRQNAVVEYRRVLPGDCRVGARLEDVSDRIEELEDGVRNFATAVLHGDEEHRAWLLEAADAFVAGNPVPPARGKGSKENRIEELEKNEIQNERRILHSMELRAENDRLNAIIAKHDLCHDLHGKVGRDEFEEGCRRETIKEFGSCGWAERLAELDECRRLQNMICRLAPWMSAAAGENMCSEVFRELANEVVDKAAALNSGSAVNEGGDA